MFLQIIKTNTWDVWHVISIWRFPEFHGFFPFHLIWVAFQPISKQMYKTFPEIFLKTGKFVFTNWNKEIWVIKVPQENQQLRILVATNQFTISQDQALIRKEIEKSYVSYWHSILLVYPSLNVSKWRLLRNSLIQHLFCQKLNLT